MFDMSNRRARTETSAGRCAQDIRRNQRVFKHALIACARNGQGGADEHNYQNAGQANIGQGRGHLLVHFHIGHVQPEIRKEIGKGVVGKAPKRGHQFNRRYGISTQCKRNDDNCRQRKPDGNFHPRLHLAVKRVSALCALFATGLRRPLESRIVI